MREDTDTQDDLVRLQELDEQDRLDAFAAYQEEHPAQTWEQHDRPAIGVWRGYVDPWAGYGGSALGLLVAIRETEHGRVLMTFENGLRVQLEPQLLFRLSRLSQGVSLDVARQLLDAIAEDVPATVGLRLRAVRRELDADRLR